MATRKGVKNKAKIAVDKLRKGEVKTQADAMRLAGYKESSIAQSTIGRTKEYKDYLATIDDLAITNMWHEDALNPDYKDKRLQYDKQKELVALKDRNPLNIVDKTGSMPVLNMVFENVTVTQPVVDGNEDKKEL